MCHLWSSLAQSSFCLTWGGAGGLGVYSLEFWRDMGVLQHSAAQPVHVSSGVGVGGTDYLFIFSHSPSPVHSLAQRRALGGLGGGCWDLSGLYQDFLEAWASLPE